MAGVLIVPADPLFFHATVAGLPLLERLVCSLGRVTDHVYVVRTPATPANAPARLGAALAARANRPALTWVDDPRRVDASRGLFVVLQPAVVDQRLCGEIEAVPGATDKVIRCHRSLNGVPRFAPPGAPAPDAAGLWFVGRARSAAFLDRLSTGADRAAEWLAGAADAKFDPGPRTCEPIDSEPARRAAEEKVFAGAPKASDTWIAANFDRHVSVRISRFLMRLPVTPNHVTLLAFGFGMLGAALIALGTYLAQVAGSALLVLSIIVDGCDGEVARLKFMESEFGRKLDFFLDNVVNACALFAAGFGYYWSDGQPFYLYASLLSAGVALASVAPVYFLFFRENKGSVDPDQADHTTDAFSITENIAGRDYIYLIFALALIGRLYWFVYLMVGGLLIFLPVTLILLLMKRSRRPHQR